MGVSSTTNRVQFACDGSSTIFNYPYKVFNPLDLLVYTYDTGSAIINVNTLNTNFTISGTADLQGIYQNGLNIVMNSAAPQSVNLIVTRAPSPVQTFAQIQNSPINSLALVAELDYLTLITQRLQDEVSRCIQLPDGLPSGFNTTLPSTILLASSALAPLTVNSGASGFQFGFVTSSAVGFSGVLPVANGGTGLSSIPAPGVLFASSATQFSALPANTTNTPNSVALRDSGGNLTASSFVGNVTGNVTGNVSGSAGSLSSINPISQGGTGANAFTPNQIIYASGTTQFAGVSPGASGLVLTSNGGSSAPTFQTVSVTTAVSTKTANYNATSADNVILVGSGCGAVNTYGVSGNTGKSLVIKKTNPGFDPCQINGSSALIEGSSFISIYRQGESYTITIDGSSGWSITDHFIPSKPFLLNSVVSGGGAVTSSFIYGQWDGSALRVFGTWRNGTVNASTASVSLAGLVVDPSLVVSTIVGYASPDAASSLVESVLAVGNGSSSILQFSLTNTVQNATVPQQGITVWGNNSTISINAMVPIAGVGG